MIPLLKFAIDAYCHSDRQNLALIELKARIAAQRARLDKIQAVVTDPATYADITQSAA